MPSYTEKDPYDLNYAADVKVLRAEFANVVAPAINKSLAELAKKHNDLKVAEAPARRFVSSFEQVRELALPSVRRWIESEVMPDEDDSDEADEGSVKREDLESVVARFLEELS